MWATLISIHIQTYATKMFYMPRDTRFTFYRNCSYKNKHKEISPAEECLKISNYFLISPKGSLQACYILGVKNITIEKSKDPILSDKQYCSPLQRRVHYFTATAGFIKIDFKKLIQDKKIVKFF